MHIEVQEIVSKIRAVEGAGISHKTLQAIVAAVLEAIDQNKRQADRLSADLDMRGAGGRGGRD